MKQEDLDDCLTVLHELWHQVDYVFQDDVDRIIRKLSAEKATECSDISENASEGA